MLLIIYVFNRAWLTDIVDGYLWIFCKYHLNDLICLLVVLPYIEILLIIINHEITSFSGIFLLSFVCAVIWELLIPLVKQDSISDPIDFLCYLIGGITYWMLLKLEINRKNNQQLNK